MPRPTRLTAPKKETRMVRVVQPGTTAPVRGVKNMKYQDDAGDTCKDACVKSGTKGGSRVGEDTVHGKWSIFLMLNLDTPTCLAGASKLTLAVLNPSPPTMPRMKRLCSRNLRKTSSAFLSMRRKSEPPGRTGVFEMELIMV